MVESDCSEVVEVMQNGGNSLGAVVTIFKECAFLCRIFARVTFAHCPRQANMAVMNLLSFLRSTMNYGMVTHLFVLEL